MTQYYKPARKVKSAIIARILAEAPPLQRRQNKTRVALACRLDDLIKEKGFSYSQFAKKIGKRPSEISKWTGGRHNFTIDTLEEIAYHLGVLLTDLLAPPKQETQTIEVVYDEDRYAVIETPRGKQAGGHFDYGKFLKFNNMAVKSSNVLVG